MKKYLALLTGAIALAAVTVVPAAAIDAQPGGRGGAVATIGAPVTDDDDETIDRCECDGGPLEAIVLPVEGGGTEVIRIDRVVNSVVRTTDGVEIGRVIRADNNNGDLAIVLIVQVNEGVLPADRIALRRTAFYIADGIVIIETTASDLASSIQGVAGA